MNDAEIQALAGALAPVFKRHVQAVVDPLLDRILQLEARAAVPGPEGPPGAPGKDAAPAPTMEEVTALAIDAVQRAVAALPTPKDGKDGQDGEPGKDAAPAPTMEEVTSLVTDAVQRAIAALPAPKDGKNGMDGPAGKDADAEAITAQVLETVTEALKSIPVPKDGKDGAGVVNMLIDREGQLVLILDDGTQREVGIVVGKDGAPGAAGRDGFGFEDFTETLDPDGRTIVRTYGRGNQVKEFRHTFAVVLDRGVWKEGGAYQKGDGTSWAGSFWIAQRDTTDKPQTSDAWRLAVKRGRDGADGVMKPPPKDGPVRVGT